MGCAGEPCREKARLFSKPKHGHPIQRTTRFHPNVGLAGIKIGMTQKINKNYLKKLQHRYHSYQVKHRTCHHPEVPDSMIVADIVIVVIIGPYGISYSSTYHVQNTIPGKHGVHL